MSNENTTVSVDRDETYPDLNAFRKSLSGDGPGEDASFDDAIRELLKRANPDRSDSDEREEAAA